MKRFYIMSTKSRHTGSSTYEEHTILSGGGFGSYDTAKAAADAFNKESEHDHTGPECDKYHYYYAVISEVINSQTNTRRSNTGQSNIGQTAKQTEEQELFDNIIKVMNGIQSETIKSIAFATKLAEALSAKHNR